MRAIPSGAFRLGVVIVPLGIACLVLCVSVRLVKWYLVEALVQSLLAEDCKEKVEAATKGRPLLLVATVVSHRAGRRIERFGDEHAVYPTVSP